jgi:lipopolysaccharide biosynthesis glycosyltransferase
MNVNFPISAMHPRLADLITNVSKIKKFNLDALATNYLNAIGNTLLNAYELEVAKDWVERSNLWTIHVANSGTLKSHVFNSAIMPILKKDRELRDECKIITLKITNMPNYVKLLKPKKIRLT